MEVGLVFFAATTFVSGIIVSFSLHELSSWNLRAASFAQLHGSTRYRLSQYTPLFEAIDVCNEQNKDPKRLSSSMESKTPAQAASSSEALVPSRHE